jgi:hypothetical protein
MSKKIKYAIISISFPYDTRIDDILDEMIQKELNQIYIGFEYINSENDGFLKESHYVMKYYDVDEDYIQEMLLESVLSAEADYNGVRTNFTLISEKIAKKEGIAF